MREGSESGSRREAIWRALAQHRAPVVTVGAALFLTALFLVETTSFTGDYQSSPGAWDLDVFYNLLALAVASSLVGFAGYGLPVPRRERRASRPTTATGISGRRRFPSFRWVAAALLPFGIGLLLLASRVASQSSCQEFSLEYPVFCPIPGVLEGVATGFAWAGWVAIASSLAITAGWFLARRVAPRPRSDPRHSELR